MGRFSANDAQLLNKAGAEDIEMVMWLIMRGALDDKVAEIYRFYIVPASNTAVGHIILENRPGVSSRQRGSVPICGRASGRCLPGRRDVQLRSLSQHYAEVYDEDLRCRRGRLRSEAPRRS